MLHIVVKITDNVSSVYQTNGGWNNDRHLYGTQCLCNGKVWSTAEYNCKKPSRMRVGFSDHSLNTMESTHTHTHTTVYHDTQMTGIVSSRTVLLNLSVLLTLHIFYHSWVISVWIKSSNDFGHLSTTMHNSSVCCPLTIHLRWPQQRSQQEKINFRTKFFLANFRTFCQFHKVQNTENPYILLAWISHAELNTVQDTQRQ